jgi:hypothetical protein
MAHPNGLREQPFTRWLDGSRQPLVIVFATEREKTDSETLEAIRAELRCLGAALPSFTRR